MAFLTFWDTYNPPCEICGETGWGWGCDFDHQFQDYPILEGLS